MNLYESKKYEIGARFKRFRETLSLSLELFARTLDVKVRTIRDIEAGRQRVNSDILTKIILLHRLNSDWLLTGKGSHTGLTITRSYEITLRMGKRLADERIRVGFTPAEFASIGEIETTIQLNYENDHKVPDAIYLSNIMKTGVDMRYILSGFERRPQLPPDYDIDWTPVTTQIDLQLIHLDKAIDDAFNTVRTATDIDNETKKQSLELKKALHKYYRIIEKNISDVNEKRNIRLRRF